MNTNQTPTLCETLLAGSGYSRSTQANGYLSAARDFFSAASQRATLAMSAEAVGNLELAEWLAASSQRAREDACEAQARYREIAAELAMETTDDEPTPTDPADSAEPADAAGTADVDVKEIAQ
jgi:hypothetical protein